MTCSGAKRACTPKAAPVRGAGPQLATAAAGLVRRRPREPTYDHPMPQSWTRVVLFDLFNTLIPGGSRGERDRVSLQIAEDLSVDPDAFAALMRDSFDARMRGDLGGVRDTLARFARRLGGEPDDRALSIATQRRLAMTRGLHDQTWALPALQALRAGGCRLGLVSDCSAETPEVWPDSPLAPHFAATSFSCETGRCKPDPECYLVAARALGVPAAECVYVGDGGSRELTGASALGMSVFRYAPPGSELGDAHDADRDWSGPTLGDLSELPSAIT
jgi:putative hydrolase of the HAD superfamily